MKKFLEICELCERTKHVVSSFGNESEYTVRSMDGKWLVVLWIDSDVFIPQAAEIIDFVRGAFCIESPVFIEDRELGFCALTIYEEE